jgi:hypothetical protein
MASLTFYRQGRIDGGIRTGIEIDQSPVLGRFEEGPDEFDPVLTWWIVLDCRGDTLPIEAEEARRWLLDHAEPIRGLLAEQADALSAGIDFDFDPYRTPPLADKIPGEDVLIELTCSASRRIEGQNLGLIMKSIAENWTEIVRNLPAVEEITM